MNGRRRLGCSARWFRLLLRLYPDDFRDAMGDGVVEAYDDRARDAFRQHGTPGLARVWLVALVDAIRSGAGERARPAASWRRGGVWQRDAVLATRRLVRAPAFATVIVATLGAGLGAFGVVHAVVQKVLIEPLPYAEPDDLYFVFRDYRAFFDLSRGWLAGTDVHELQQAGGVIEGAVGISRQLTTFSAGAIGDPTEIAVMVITPNLFELLGVEPWLGRTFAPHEVGPGRPAVTVLTHALWSRMGADPTVVGTTVRLNREPYTVIGVMPEAFAFVRHASLGPSQRADAYTTYSIDLAGTSPTAGSYAGLVRARRGASVENVEAAVAAVGQLVDRRDFQGRGLTLYPVGLGPDLVAGLRPALLVLGYSGLFLLLVLMANLASVLLSRAAEREHEFSVARALGANDAAVFRATLLEGGILGAVGGGVGAAAASWATPVLMALAPLDLPRRDAVHVDWTIAAAVTATGLLLGVVAATLPAAWAARAPLATLLAASAVRGGGGHGRMRQGMVVAQVALSLVLLGTGGLVVRSFERLLRADPGFQPAGLLTLRVPMPAQVLPEAGDVLARQERVTRALRAIAGVTGVGSADVLPLTAAANQTTITFPGAPGNTGNREHDAPLVDLIGTRAGYIEALRLRVLEGRPFEDARPPGVREAIIDRVLARAFFPASSALGATIQYGDAALSIIGVVEQPRLYAVHEDGRGQVFVRADDWGYRSLSFVVRTEREPTALVPEVRAAIRDVDAQLAITDVRSMDDIVGESLRPQRLSAVLVMALAAGALLLAAMGVFSIVSGAVTRRRHELAVRLALGASHRCVLGLVLGEGMRLLIVGAVAGVPGMFAAGGFVRSVLVGVTPFDPITWLAVLAGLAVVTLAASYIPARRVLAIDAAQSLRNS